jgi:oligosaccharyltransferase complex subunit delta (ribophorin II)
VINSKNIPANVKTNLCAKLAVYHKDSKLSVSLCSSSTNIQFLSLCSSLQDSEKNFYYVAATKLLGCTEKIAEAVVSQTKASFEKEFTSTQEMYYVFSTQQLLDAAATKTPATLEKLSKNLLAVLKKDDSLPSLGYGFTLASYLGASAASVTDRIEDAFAQADEVDGKLLQFEGGLSVTALIVNGAFRVATANKKPAPTSAETTRKFTSYFLSRRSVTQPKGASLLLESLRTIMTEKTISPIAIRVADNGQIAPEDPTLKIRISDLLGEALKEKPAAVKLTLTSKSDNKKVIDGENLVPVAADATLYKIDLKQKQLPKGQYKVDIAAGSYKQSNLIVNLLGRVRVEKLELTVSEADSTTAAKKISIDKNGKFPEVYLLDHQQKLSLRFDLLDDQTSKVISVHQAFVRFVDADGAEIIFVAEQDVVKAYKFEMDIGARAGDFSGRSGIYTVDLIIGDASLVNSFVRNLGQINLKFSLESKKESANSAPRQARKEIHHMFREPEKRPPRFVSDVFAGLCLAPILILFILWGRVGTNLSNFSFSLSALGFHGGLGAIFSLYLCFWLKLDMFQTIQYLLALSLLTFLCGNRVLRFIASKRLEKQEKN